MIRLPRSTAVHANTKYISLGLRDLPFPTEPVVDPYNQDPRRNGTIYAESPVKSEIDRFENLLIRPDDFANRVRLSYLWSKGDREGGRGMGKTALLRYFRQRINHDWGYTEFNGQFSAVVVYVAFPSQVDRRYMEQLSWSALVDICRIGVLDAARAALRLKFIPTEFHESLLSGSDADSILKDAILKGLGISITDLNENVLKLLQEAGVQQGPAISLSEGTFEEYLRSLRKDGNIEPFYVPHDTKNLDYSRGLLFNDIVYFLNCAGFNGGYLFIDDIENLVDLMTRKNRIEFAKEFGLCSVRPGYANTALNFFSCVLTTHQQASVGLSQAWAEAGLSTIARLDPSSPNSIELPLPTENQAKEIITAHLDYYRLDKTNAGSCKPFTEEGITELLKNRQHPRDLLSNAARVVLRAVEKNASEIDPNIVIQATTNVAPTISADITSGIDDAL